MSLLSDNRRSALQVWRQNARRIRRRFESRKIPPLLLACLYESYTHVDDVTKFVTTAADIFPRLNCGIASTYLQSELGVGNIVNGSYKGHGHTFVLIDSAESDLIIDITADQFG